MATRPRVICHKERKPSRVKEKSEETERFISADEFLREFSFSIDTENSNRFTNNFVDFPKISEFKRPPSQFSPAGLVTPLPATSLQDLTTQSDTHLQESLSENSKSIQLLKSKQQSLTDVSSDKRLAKKKQKKATPKPRLPDSSTCRRDRRPDTGPKVQTHSKDKFTLPSEIKLKTRKVSHYIPDDSHQITFDSSRTLTSRPRSLEVTLPSAGTPPGLPLDLQNGLLLSAVHLNLSAQRAYAETEKEAVIQLSRLHAYKQRLLGDSFKLRQEEDTLEIDSMASFAAGELGSVEEVLARLKLAGAQIMKLSDALSRAQSTVKLNNISLSERDKELCEKRLGELSSVATRSLARIRPLLGQVSDVCDKVQLSAKEREGDLKRLKETSEKLDRYTGVMLSKFSLQSHVAMLEDNLDLIREPEKFYMPFPGDL